VGAIAKRPAVSDHGSVGALRVRGISKRYGDVEALREVSFEAHAGEVVAIVGPNGAGKTTLLSIIAGTQHASAGSLELAGAGGRGALVGWAPQQAALYSRLTVAENLMLFARLEKVADAPAAVERMLAQTGLGARANERHARLSGGNRQRVNVALALLSDPPVLALDEPSAALDPAQRERLWRFIAALAREGRTVVFSSHNMAEVERHATRAVVLDEGALLFDGAPSQLVAEMAARTAAGAAPPSDLEAALVAYIDAAAPAAHAGAGSRSRSPGEEEQGER
jgi:ABC-2 type transport system ATP-binding protein